MSTFHYLQYDEKYRRFYPIHEAFGPNSVQYECNRWQDIAEEADERGSVEAAVQALYDDEKLFVENGHNYHERDEWEIARDKAEEAAFFAAMRERLAALGYIVKEE